jgi:hypothetical protein
MLICKILRKEKDKNTKKSNEYDKKYNTSSEILLTHAIMQKAYWRTICASAMKEIANTTGIIIM